MDYDACFSERCDLRSILALADIVWLDKLRHRLAGPSAAVRERDTARLFSWFVTALQYQGTTDAVATGYIAEHGLPAWSDMAAELAVTAACGRLQSHWHFAGCGYTKSGPTCAEPPLLPSCPLPVHPLRNGRLSQAAWSLFLFIRDVCDDDLVGWIDERLAASDDPTRPNRTARMRAALLDPMRNIFGVSDKVLSLALADFLLVADPSRERWVSTGASMIVVDSLVHNFLTRTGVLGQLGREHAYGAACYAPDGCAAVISALANAIDARDYHPDHPARFPRFIQKAIWQFCAAGELNICNGNRIDDRGRCRQLSCPIFDSCERIPLHGRQRRRAAPGRVWLTNAT